MKYVLGVDFGGGASKATLLGEDGKVVSVSTAEYPTKTGDNGLREQNPYSWYQAAITNIKNVISFGKINSDDIVCVCFDAATHTAVLMDENFKVLRDSIYWTDTRSWKQKEYLADNYKDDIFEKFKHYPETIWTLPELLWIKENEPKVWGKVKRITFAKDYVRHLFTGDFITDYIEAEGSMFFDFNLKDWSEKYLNILGIDKNYLPKVVNPCDIAGEVCESAAKESGLKVGTKVICGSTDTAMEVLASGAIECGQTVIKLATAGRICVITDRLYGDKHLVNYSHVIDGLYYPGTATKGAASSLRWFRDAFGGNYDEFNQMAESVPIGTDGLIFHPYINGELTPLGNPNIRGSFFGVSSAHGKAHFVRAIMEGVGFSLKDCKNYLEKQGITHNASAFIIGGGAKSGIWKRIIADCLNIRLISTENNDSSFGSCILAAVKAGFFKDISEALSKCRCITDTVEPIAKNVKIYEEIFKKYERIKEFLKDLNNA